jgi:hypothetical protein
MRKFAGMFMLMVCIVGMMSIIASFDFVKTGEELFMVTYWTICLFIAGYAGVGLLIDSDRDTL